MSATPHGDGFYVNPDTLLRLGDGDMKAGRRVLRAMIDLECAHAPITGPTEKPETVRAAVEADEEAIMDLVRADIVENARHIAPIDEDRVRDFIRQATREGKATIGVIDGPNGLIGMIALQPFCWWWSSEYFLQEMFCYMAVEHRTSKAVGDLIRFSRWFSDDLSRQLGYQVFLLSGVTATKETRAKVSLYRRLSNFIGIFCAYPDPTNNR